MAPISLSLSLEISFAKILLQSARGNKEGRGGADREDSASCWPLRIEIQQLHPFSATVPLQENSEQRQFEVGQMTSFLRAKEERREV